MAEDPLAQWLSYRETLPIRCVPAAAGDLPGGWAEQNLRMLAAVATLEERGRLDAENPQSQEFERLNHKFDLMIDLLGALLRAGQPLPPPRAIRLSREGLAWPAVGETPTIGSRVDVEVFLHACVPLPFTWRGEIVAGDPAENCLRFLTMPEALQAALERHVFTRHRRSVADARSPANRVSDA